VQVAVLLRARDVAEALAYLHARNLVHGNLKTSNVLMARDPSDPYRCIAKVSGAQRGNRVCLWTGPSDPCRCIAKVSLVSQGALLCPRGSCLPCAHPGALSSPYW
jgi:serine/threonine protein kinase